MQPPTEYPPRIQRMARMARMAARMRLSDMPPGQRRAVIAGLTAATVLFLAGFIFAGYFWSLSRQFPRSPYKQPSRLYVTPTRLEPGTPLTAAELVVELKAADYQESTGKNDKDKNNEDNDEDNKDEDKADRQKEPAALNPGTFRRAGESVTVHLRRFPTPDSEAGDAGGHVAEVSIRGGRVRGIQVDGKEAESLTLEPPLLASFYGPELNERRPVTLEELPEYVTQAVLAAEDDNFPTHPGVSATGIARALWVNLRGGELQQGGSTITQQLVKNLYLTSKRSLARKAKEAWIAVMLEARYGKDTILQAYLNEIYWGKSGPANVIGLGAASWAYFGKHPSQLTLAEAATLAGMIQSPGNYLPTQHPEKARERRDWVLGRLAELGWVPEEQVSRALTEPMKTNPREVVTRPYAPYFANLAKKEARERFEIEDLPDQGYILFATLRWRDQRQAEKALTSGLASLDKGRGNRGKEPLQGALLSVDPRNGAILAYVGGRDFSQSQFDRVMRARRQAGSTFKPVVYAAAFEEAVVSPASLLKDSPITVKAKGMLWKPQNYDRGFRGMVTVRSSLEQSLNIPTVRLALQVGLTRVIDLARDMGLSAKFDPVPALALGAFEATPYEMAQVYATLANDGARPELHGLAVVRDRSGEVLLGDDLPAPRRVLPAEAAFLVTSILQGAMDHGTASAARGLGVREKLAGKTGTTNDRRDNWFAGYSPDRVSVVWVGYDDNSRTRLSGARAALPIWSRFTAAVRPSQGYQPFTPPKGIVTLTVDPATGQLATEYCPHRVSEVFPEWQAPAEPCVRHRPSAGQYAAVGKTAEPAIDPVTGEPIHPSGAYQNDEGQIEISNFGYGYGQEPAPGALPYITEPLTDDLEAGPAEAGATGEWDEGETEIEESSIEIRPSQPRPQAPVTPEPAAPAPAPESSPVLQGGTGAGTGTSAEVRRPPEELEPVEMEVEVEVEEEPEATPPPPM